MEYRKRQATHVHIVRDARNLFNGSGFQREAGQQWHAKSINGPLLLLL